MASAAAACFCTASILAKRAQAAYSRTPTASAASVNAPSSATPIQPKTGLRAIRRSKKSSAAIDRRNVSSAASELRKNFVTGDGPAPTIRVTICMVRGCGRVPTGVPSSIGGASAGEGARLCPRGARASRVSRLPGAVRRSAFTGVWAPASAGGVAARRSPAPSVQWTSCSKGGAARSLSTGAGGRTRGGVPGAVPGVVPGAVPGVVP